MNDQPLIQADSPPLSRDEVKQPGPTAPGKLTPVSRVPEIPADFDHYKMTVAEARAEFQSGGIEVTERTIQRYCNSGKLHAVKVDTETRQPADREPTMFLIDATTVGTRIQALIDARANAAPTQRPSESDNAANGRDDGAAERDGVATGREESAVEELKTKIQSLEIDKAVRDRMLEQVKEDRKELLDQLRGFVDRVTEQAHKIGQLETKLELAAPAPEPEPEETGRGDSPHPEPSQFGV